MSAHDKPERGFMFPHDEVAYEDIDEPMEQWVDQHDDGESGVIEEYTVRDRRYHLPAAEWVLEWLQESAWENEAGENVEYGADADCIAAIESALQLVADRGSGWMCDERVAEHRVAIIDGQPYLDGEPWGDPIPPTSEPVEWPTIAAKRMIDGVLVDVEIPAVS